MTATLAASAMIILHLATGGEIDINTHGITNTRGAEPGHSNFVKGTNCLISMSDGKFIAVRETCDEVRKAIERSK